MSPGFSLESYRQLLVLARRRGWRFTGFDDERVGAGDASGAVMLRHDVDYSMHMAVEMGEINAHEGVSGTFFVLLRGDVYNLLSPPNLNLARRLVALGQRVALHHASSDAGAGEHAEMSERIVRDHRLVREELPELAPVFSWHNPTAHELAHGRELRPGGLLNAYAPAFAGGPVYVSDSNLRTGPERFAELIEDPGTRARGLQMLIHPINWVCGQGGRDMRAVLARALARVAREREHDFLFNRVYRAGLPSGMPQGLLDELAGGIESALGRAPAGES